MQKVKRQWDLFIIDLDVLHSESQGKNSTRRSRSREAKLFKCLLAWWSQNSWYRRVPDGLICSSLDKICKLILVIGEEYDNTAPQKHYQLLEHWGGQPQDLLTALPSASRQIPLEFEYITSTKLETKMQTSLRRTIPSPSHPHSPTSLPYSAVKIFPK